MMMKEKDGSMWFSVAPWWMFMLKYNKKDKWKAYQAQVNNVRKYAKWCIKKLKKALGRPLVEGEKLSTVHMYMNEKTVKDLQNYLDAMSWLNYSPTVDDTVPKGWLKIGNPLEDR